VVPLTASRLAAAEARWKAAAPESYHLALRLKVARMEPVVYDMVVRGDGVVAATRNGVATSAAQAGDYTVSGLFRLLASELRITETDATGLPSVRAELFVRFDASTGRLERYRRSTARRATGLGVEVLEYSPEPGRLMGTLTMDTPSPR
jgi:hypothetical protein